MLIIIYVFTWYVDSIGRFGNSKYQIFFQDSNFLKYREVRNAKQRKWIIILNVCKYYIIAQRLQLQLNNKKHSFVLVTAGPSNLLWIQFIFRRNFVNITYLNQRLAKSDQKQLEVIPESDLSKFRNFGSLKMVRHCHPFPYRTSKTTSCKVGKLRDSVGSIVSRERVKAEESGERAQRRFSSSSTEWERCRGMSVSWWRDCWGESGARDRTTRQQHHESLAAISFILASAYW